ncbi:MAG: hypothetical protein ABI461_08960 [Polyangiaceae bacterium]
MRKRSETAVNILGGLVATTFLKRAMKSAMAAPANTNGSALVAVVRSVIDSSTRNESSVNQAANIAYGAGWMAMVGLAGAHFPVRSAKLALAGGAALGVLVWASGQLAGKRLGAGSRSRAKRNPRQMAKSFATHLLYGVAAATPTALRAALRQNAPVAV